MSDKPGRLQRKGLLRRAGELLLDGHADCIKELGEFIVAYDRINELLHELKRGVRRVKTGKTFERFDQEYYELHTTLGGDLERVSAEFLVAEWPKSRPDVWQHHQATLRNALTAFTNRLVQLLAEYDTGRGTEG